MLVLLLVLTNLASLVNARIHTAGFRAIEVVLRGASTQLAEAALSRSLIRMAQGERLRVARQAQLARSMAARSTGRIATHAARSVFTIPGRLLPFVGSVAIVGMPAYDVNSDCQTAADMNEILAALDQQPVDAGPICGLADKVPSPSVAWARAKQIAGGAQRTVMEWIERKLGAPS